MVKKTAKLIYAFLIILSSTVYAETKLGAEISFNSGWGHLSSPFLQNDDFWFSTAQAKVKIAPAFSSSVKAYLEGRFDICSVPQMINPIDNSVIPAEAQTSWSLHKAYMKFRLPFGFKEVEGIHSRTNFDLSQHEKFSGKSIKYFDPQTNESYTPFVIETSIGVDRMFLSIMCHSYCEETLENGETRVVLKLPAALAPVKLCVMPLVKKDGLPEKAREIIDNLKFHFNCQYDEKDSIGKRYRRQDAIGTPYCVTVDHDTLKDNMVTLRFRDTMEQERVNIADLNGIIEDKVSIASLLKKLQ